MSMAGPFGAEHLLVGPVDNEVGVPPARPIAGLWKGLGVLAVLVGVLVGVSGGVVVAQNRQLSARGTPVEATVLDRSRLGRLHVTFRTSSGTVIDAHVASHSGDRGADQVAVVYDPQHPEVVGRPGSFDGGMGTVMVGIGVLFGCAGLALLLHGVREANRVWPPLPASPVPGAALPSPGWYADPWVTAGRWRWWSGRRWTAGVVAIAPQPPTRRALGTLPIAAAGVAAGGLAGAFGAAIGVGYALRAASSNVVLRLVGSEFALWAVLLAACVVVGRRYGIGASDHDFGFRVRLGDLWSGFGLVWLAFAASTLASVPLLGHPSLRGRNTQVFTHFRHSTPSYAVAVGLAAVGAPLVEELFFRGLVLRSLASRMPTAVAVVVQALVFGLAHVNPAVGTHNASVVVGVGAMGLVLGMSAVHYRRLGPGIVAHALNNAFVAALILLR